ncbi:hypothetical protein PVAND_017429 [Polypedilum vanderplanki]|uniref:ZAD domain-containing protein n=1 Tax=Polypedilum vanderplanki TaxID=319348 RepID=A0A9J6BJG5_POLVA|nr:hypothetical protein PVAND_017429 [Polypedilum vanderplanki]
MKETLKANIKLKQCKICENLECSDNEKFIDMFSDLSIIADLNFTTGIITVNIPNLSPSLICSSCLIQLRSFADFKRKALESEENFRTRNSKIEKKFWEDEKNNIL